MVLVANTKVPKSDDICPQPKPETQRIFSSFGENQFSSHSRETHETSDVLLTPRLLENEDSKLEANGIHNGGTATVPLEAIQQAVILAQCLLIEKSTPYDEMQGRLRGFVNEYACTIMAFFLNV